LVVWTTATAFERMGAGADTVGTSMVGRVFRLPQWIVPVLTASVELVFRRTLVIVAVSSAKVGQTDSPQISTNAPECTA
jgi:hypothetical protein